MMYINFFGGVLWEEGKCLFDRVTILFLQCNNKDYISAALYLFNLIFYT